MNPVFAGIRGTALMVALLTIVVRLFAVGKELAIAAVFGVGSEVDALILAGAVPVFMVGVVAGSLPAAIVPVMSRLQAAGRLDAQSALVADMAGRILVILASLTLAIAAFAPVLAVLLAPQAWGTLGGQVTWLFVLMAPSLLLNGYAAFWCGVLNGLGRYAVPATTPMLTPVAMLIAIGIGGSATRIEALAVAGLIGGVIEAVILMLYAGRLGLTFVPKWGGAGPDASRVMAEYMPMLMGSVLMGSTVLVDQVMAAQIAEGAVSALNYASKVPILIVGLIGTALATAALPVFSRLAAAGSLADLKREGLRLARATFAASAAIVVTLWLFSERIVEVLFQRGQFDEGATALVSHVQVFAALQIPFFCVSLIAGRMLSALQKNTYLMWGAALSLVLNVILNLWLGRLMGVAGIALSTALVYLVSACLLWMIVLRVLGARRGS